MLTFIEKISLPHINVEVIIDKFSGEEISIFSDIPEAKEIPTFKRMCICIMKNDHLCKYMGFSLNKNEMARRKNIMEKYKALL